MAIGYFPVLEIHQKRCHDTPAFLHISHRRTTPTREARSMYHRQICLKTQLLTSILTKRKLRSAEELLAIQKNGCQRLGQQEDREAEGVRCCRRRFLSSVTNRADRTVLLKDTMQNTSLSRIRHSVALSTDTHNATDNRQHTFSLHMSPDARKGRRHMF